MIKKDVKIVFLGSSGKLCLRLIKFIGVGKSSMIARYITEEYKEKTELTLGSVFFSKELFINDTLINLQVNKYF